MSSLRLEMAVDIVALALAAVGYLIASELFTFIGITLGAIGVGLALGRSLDSAPGG